MSIATLLLALSAAACSSPAIDEAPCAFGVRGECIDSSDHSERTNRDDLAERTKPVSPSVLDVTDRANRDDLANRTKGRPDAALDVTDRAGRDDVANRTGLPAVSDLDVSHRRNRDDTTDRTPVCP